MVVSLVTVAIVTGVLTTLYLLWWNSRTRRTLDLIPGPKALPIIGNGLQLKDGYEGSVQLNELCREYGKTRGVTRLWLGTIPTILLSRPQSIEVLLNSSKHLKKAFMYDFLHPWLARGLLTSLRDKWKVRRRLLTPTFHFKILTEFQQVFNEHARTLVDILQQKIAENPEPFDIFPYVTRCTLDVLCDTAMGKNVGAQLNTESDYVDAVHRITVIVQTRIKKPLWKPDLVFYRLKEGKEFLKCLKILHGFTRSVIEERSAELDDQLASQTGKITMEDLQTDKPFLIGKQKRLAFLDMLLIAAKGGADLSHADIQEEVDTFMFEGHDTTASGVGWALYCLGRHPDVQTRVHDELDDVFAGDDRDITTEDMTKMKYLECAIKESMRLFPPVPMFGRETEQDCVIGGYNVLKGTTAMVVTTALHLDPEHFPDPEKFDPDRWLPENCAGRHPYCYVPFSAGSRNCIGQKFAMSEDKVIVATVMRAFSVRAHQSVEEARATGELILRPQHELVVSLTRRQ